MTMTSGKTFTIVIFGASGDLTQRKLIPALYNNFRKNRLPGGLRIVGFARRDWRHEQFRDHLDTGIKEFGTAFDPNVWSFVADGLLRIALPPQELIMKYIIQYHKRW
ncbi:MAG: hypothetical protein R6U50_03565 [Desulfobacterales bacterium]